jgi:glycopeptide antibiotics resistance protein
MPKFNLSISGLSIGMALGLAVWEVLFFFFGWEGLFSWFAPNRLGFHLAWISSIYLSFQLISIPFALRASRGRFIGIVDGIASLLPLLIVVVVVFGKPHLLNTSERWEAALLLMLVTGTDLFGGYAFNIALSRRMVDVGSPA